MTNLYRAIRIILLGGCKIIRTHLLAGALAMAPFSGVDLSKLTDVPMLVRKTILKASGKQLLTLGKGMKLEGRNNEQVVVTQQGFFIEIEVELAAGRYGIAVRSRAPNRGSDSYWLTVDGRKLKQPFALPVGTMGERSMAVKVSGRGKHRIRLTLRESPGSIIKQMELYKIKSKIPIPPMRRELLGKHPRIFFTSGDLKSMRDRLSNKDVQQFYKLAGILTRKPPAFRHGKRNGGSFRSLGSYAFSYLMKPDEKKLKPILKWLEMATTYPHCGVDLDAEYFMEGVALTYDWLYEYIPQELRARVKDTIARQCREVYEASLHGRTGGGLSFQQNHYWYAHLSLALGAAATCGELPKARTWLAWAWDRFERIALSFSPDGGFHEGPAYWDYSMPTLYIYTDLYEWCTGLHVPNADKGLSGQAEFRFHHLYPGLALSAALEDSQTKISRPPIRLFLWEAKRFNDPVVMGMAKQLNRRPTWLCWNLLWLNEKIRSSNPFESVALGKYYPDIETAFARTSWERDATYVAFVSRPLGGHKWAELCAKFGVGGTGHNHPAQNHFVLFGRGEVLVGDPGYTYEKRTRNHNTVLVDGKGQYGDGEMWPHPQPGRAHITQFVTDGDITIITGDAASAYPSNLGLTRFSRTLVLAGRDLVVICDRLSADKPRTFSWLLHHYGKLEEQNGAWTITRNRARLNVVPLLPAELKVETSTYRPRYVHPQRNLTPKEADIHLLELKTEPVTETTFLVPLLVSNSNEKLPMPKNVSTDRYFAIHFNNTIVTFNRGEGSMKLELPWGKTFDTDARVVVARLHDGKQQVVTAPVRK